MSTYLEDLIPKKIYTRNDYLAVLRSMLPKGSAWIIPLPDENAIKMTSILSNEAWGSFSVSVGMVYVNINSIPSSEAWGIPNLADPQSISINSISSSEAWGNPTVGIAQTISMNSIGSSEAWGSPTVSAGGISVTMNSIESTEAWGSPEVILGTGWLQYCDFETDLCSGWDSEFTTDWTQETESGEGIAQRASNGDDRLYPVSGAYLTGDFTIEFGFWRSASEGAGNNSIHMQLKNPSDVLKLDVYYLSGTINGNTGSNSMSAGPVEQKMKIERVSGVIWVYRWTGSAWEREDSWSTPGTSLTNGENLYLVVNGADGVNGFSYIGINGSLT